MTDFFKSGEVPKVGKIAALLWLHGLHGAIFAVEKDARTIRLILQHEALSIGSQLEEALDEIEFRQTFESREPRDLRIRQSHLTRPPATGGATLAFVKNRHLETLAISAGIAKPRR